MTRPLVKTLSLVALGVAICGAAAAQNTPATTTGDKAFASSCAGCHGGDGKGSDKAPGIAVMPEVIAMTDAQLINVVTNGTDAGMPPFRRLGDENIRGIVRYLRTLQGVPPSPGGGAAPAAPAAGGGRANGGGNGGGRGRGGANAGAAGVGRPAAAAAAPTGNAANGRALFFGERAQCSTCHSISGEGGALGPDMTAYGATRDAAAIQQSILHGPAPAPAGRGGGGFGGGAAPAKPAEIKTKSGQTITGMVRSEDNLSLAVQTREGRFYFLNRADLASVNYLKNLHPTDYEGKLSATELNDLATFLIVTGRAAPADPQPAAPARGGRRGGL